MIDIHKMTVLIIDDNISTCKLINRLMSNMGYGEKFLMAGDGQEALDILKRESVDLILLDYNMPRMSGAETLNHIREDRNLRDLPVIMVTAEAVQDYVAEVGETQIDAYILKPLSIAVLKEKISCVITKANNPPPMIYHLKKARTYEEEGYMDNAIDEAKLARDANPNVTRPIRELGYYYFKKNDLKEAEKWLLKAAEINTLDVFAFHHLGELYLKLNDIEKAAPCFEKAMEISPRHLSRGIHFGKTLIKMKAIQKAIDVFDKVLELSGSTLELQEEIADFCIENGVDGYAAKLLEHIVREKQDRADLLFKLAKILEKSGDMKRAILFLENADNIDKENTDIKMHLAKDYLELNKPLMAEIPLKQILKINNNHEGARELIRNCTKI